MPEKLARHDKIPGQIAIFIAYFSPRTSPVSLLKFLLNPYQGARMRSLNWTASVYVSNPRKKSKENPQFQFLYFNAFWTPNSPLLIQIMWKHGPISVIKTLILVAVWLTSRGFISINMMASARSLSTVDVRGIETTLRSCKTVKTHVEPKIFLLWNKNKNQGGYYIAYKL